MCEHRLGGDRVGRDIRRAGRQQQPRPDRGADREHPGRPGEGRGVAVNGGPARRRRWRPACDRRRMPRWRPAASVLSSAVPIEPPTCCPVLTSAEATPTSAPATPRVAVSMAGAKISPRPRAHHQQARQHIGARSPSPLDAGEHQHRDSAERHADRDERPRPEAREQERLADRAGGHEDGHIGRNARPETSGEKPRVCCM